MSNFLAIDVSSRYLSVVAVKGGRIARRYIADCALNHSVRLMAEADAALKEAGLTPSECDFFAAVTGPGSFTGIRIGISAAKGFALGAGKPLKSVTSFDTIAYNVNCGEFAAVIDAAHGHYYVCGYRDGAVNTPPAYLAEERVNALGVPLFGFEELTLDGYSKVDNDLYTATVRCPASLCSEMNALYVRKSQAEEGRK